MGSLIVILLVIVSFFALALLVLTFREFICVITYLWKKAALVGGYIILGLSVFVGLRIYLDHTLAAVIGILVVFILNAFSYRSYRKSYQELLGISGLGDSRRISRKKLLEVYRLSGRSIDNCELCGEGGLTLDIHHARPLAEGGNNEPSNLRLLCPNCHRREHDEMRG